MVQAESVIRIAVDFPVQLIRRVDEARAIVAANEGKRVSRRDMMTRLLHYALDCRDAELQMGITDPVQMVPASSRK